MPLDFAKMHGAGNDFVMLDAWDGSWERWLAAAGIDAPEGVRRLCDRRRGVGADGLILARPPVRGGGVRMEFRNADGSRAAMCGNGGRCLARFAAECGRAPWGPVVLETDAGLLAAETRVDGDLATVRLELPPPSGLRLGVSVRAGGRDWLFHAVDTGVPHAVHFLPPGATPADLAALDATGIGRAVRHAPEFAPAGANVDFACVLPEDACLLLRTYERGVEDETDACGTGAVAAAVLARQLGLLDAPAVRVRPRSGIELKVDFLAAAPHLTGPAELSFRGCIP